MAGLLHLIHDPVPVPDGLHRDGAAGRQPSQKCPIGFPIVIYSHRGFRLSCFVHSDKQRIFLCASQPIKCLMLQHLPWFLPIVGYGTHQSVLQRFHPIKLDVAGSIPVSRSFPFSKLRLAKFPAAQMQPIHPLNELRMPAGCAGIHALKRSAVAILTVIFNSIYKDATATNRTAGGRAAASGIHAPKHRGHSLHPSPEPEPRTSPRQE